MAREIMAGLWAFLSHIWALTPATFLVYNYPVTQNGIIYIAERPSGAYVGQTRQRLAARRRAHGYDARTRKGKYPFAAAIRKYGLDSFRWRAVLNAPVAALNALETTAIAWLSPRYNATAGGHFCSALVPESRERQKAALRGRFISEETRRRMSESAKRRVRTAEEIARLVSYCGHPHTEEAKAKIRAAKLGPKNPNYRHGLTCGGSRG